MRDEQQARDDMEAARRREAEDAAATAGATAAGTALAGVGGVGPGAGAGGAAGAAATDSDIDPLAVAAKPDSNSVKDRGNNPLANLLRLSEWEEVREGVRIGSTRRGRHGGGAAASPAPSGAR